MVAKLQKPSRAPSVKIAKARAANLATRRSRRGNAKVLEEKNRKAGGYGRAVVSAWDVPVGGMQNSPAYRAVVCRWNSTEKLPAPADRDGAPVKGGFAVSKWPPNTLVDPRRALWLPDDWGQAVKNTGPGGVYYGWISPTGQFIYHRHGYTGAIEDMLGRKLSGIDGCNGILRGAISKGKPEVDKKFLQQCLTPTERKHILPASAFHFAVVSARRATHDLGIKAVMCVEGQFRSAGVRPTWYVDAESLAAYKKLGLTAKVGGKLTPARNMALDDADKLGKKCVQVSDDISKWEYLDVEKQNFRGEKTFDKANAALAGSRRQVISPLAAAQFIMAKMRSSPKKPQLGGVFPTVNATLALGVEEIQTEHFILGDFLVVDSSKCRFDTTMSLKEDYDYTCSHIAKHGSVLRCNRMFAHAMHASNVGGAVATRDESGSKERYNIAILQKKWPGVFSLNSKRKDEVLMYWGKRGSTQSNQGSKGAREARVAVRKTVLKRKTPKTFADLPPSTKLRYTGKAAAPYITKRCKKFDKTSVQDSLGTKYVDASGTTKTYGYADLRYDLKCGRLEVAKQTAKKSSPIIER